MKGRADRKLKGLEAARKNKKIKKYEVKEYGKTKTEPSHAICFHIFISHLCGMWRDIRG
jgi:hypothetical protein